MIFDTMVKDIIIEDGVAKGVVTDKGETYTADEIVAAVGRRIRMVKRNLQKI